MNGCEFCNQNVALIFEDVNDETDWRVYMENNQDYSAISLGNIITRRHGKVEPDTAQYLTIHYCPFCGRKLDK